MVPGGQRYYIDPSTGALRFSVPHSGSDVPDAIYNIEAIENGTFGLAYAGWMACQAPSNGSHPLPENETNPWQLFAQLPSITFADDCIPVNVITTPWEAPANNSAAAWEYI